MKTSCKVGTIPERIWLRYRYRIEVGKMILFRRHKFNLDGWQHEWTRGRIWRVNPDGYFFVELM